MGGFLITGLFAGRSRDSGMRTERWAGGSPKPNGEELGKGFGGTTLGACTRDWITGGYGMTGTLIYVTESSMMDV